MRRITTTGRHWDWLSASFLDQHRLHLQLPSPGLNSIPIPIFVVVVLPHSKFYWHKDRVLLLRFFALRLFQCTRPECRLRDTDVSVRYAPLQAAHRCSETSFKIGPSAPTPALHRSAFGRHSLHFQGRDLPPSLALASSYSAEFRCYMADITRRHMLVSQGL